MKALLIECDPGNTLGGSCVRDVHNVANFLINHQVRAENITILLTDLSNSQMADVTYKSAKDILTILDNLELESGDTLIVLVSGHGYSTRDNDGDEIDGRDEYINVGFRVTDDLLYEKITLKHNREGINILMLGDTCHSGTLFDLPYRFDVYNDKVISETRRKDQLYLNAISISACKDSQVSMCDFGTQAGFGGSLTVALLEYPETFSKLLNMDYSDLRTVFDRLKMLNQAGIVCISQN